MHYSSVLEVLICGDMYKSGSNDNQPLYAMGEFDKIFGYRKSQYIINAVIMNTKKIIYMNRQTGRDMHIEIVKYQIWRKINKAKINELKN